MTQNDAILRALKRGKVITAGFALREYGVFRLAARIHELRQRGVDIHRTIVEKNNRRFAAYWIPT